MAVPPNLSGSACDRWLATPLRCPCARRRITALSFAVRKSVGGTMEAPLSYGGLWDRFLSGGAHLTCASRFLSKARCEDYRREWTFEGSGGTTGRSVRSIPAGPRNCGQFRGAAGPESDPLTGVTARRMKRRTRFRRRRTINWVTGSLPVSHTVKLRDDT